MLQLPTGKGLLRPRQKERRRLKRPDHPGGVKLAKWGDTPMADPVKAGQYKGTELGMSSACLRADVNILHIITLSYDLLLPPVSRPSRPLTG